MSKKANKEIMEIIDTFESVFKDASYHSFAPESEISPRITFEQFQILLHMLHEEYGTYNGDSYDINDWTNEDVRSML